MIKQGQLICIDKGEYSDYQVIGFFVALSTFNPMDSLNNFLNKNEDQKEPYGFNQDQFLAFLLAEGFLLEIEYQTLHLGSSDYKDVKFFKQQYEKDDDD